jgi:mRNA interferase MazF
VVIQSDDFNESRIRTIVCAAITSNLRLSEAPGNVLLRARDSALPKESVVNVSAIVSLDRDQLDERIASLPQRVMQRIDEGLRLVLDLRP